MKKTVFLLHAFNLIVSSVMGFLLLPIITKFMSVEDVGVYSQLFSVISLGLLISNAGVINFNMRFFKQAPNKSIHITSVMVLQAVFFLLAFLLFTLIVVYILKLGTYILIVSVFILLLMSFYRVTITFYHARENHFFYVLFNLLEVLFRYILTMSLVVYVHTYIGYFHGYLLSSFVCVTVLMIVVRKKVKKFKIEYDKDYILHGLKYSFSFLLSGIFIWILTSSDLIILALFESDSVVGIYNAGYSLGFQVATLLLMVMYNSIEPRILSKSNDILRASEEDRASYFLKPLKVYNLLVLPLVPFLVINSKDIYSILFSSNYSDSVIVFSIVIIGGYLWGIYKLLALKYSVEKKPRKYTVGVALGAITNIFLNFTLIPSYGYIGAAFATLAAYFVLFIYIIFSEKPHYYFIPLTKNQIKIITLSLLPLYVTSFVEVEIVLIGLFIRFALYAFLIYMLFKIIRYRWNLY